MKGQVGKMRFFRVGGLRFFRVGRFQVSWCIVRRKPVVRQKPVYDDPLAFVLGDLPSA